MWLAIVELVVAGLTCLKNGADLAREGEKDRRR